MPCSGHQNIARSHRCKTPKSRRNRIQHYRHTVLLSTGPQKTDAMLGPQNHCSESPMFKTKTKAKLHSASSPHCLPGHKPMPCSGHQNFARSYRCKTLKSRRNCIQHYRHTAYRAIDPCHARATKTSLGVTDAKH